MPIKINYIKPLTSLVLLSGLIGPVYAEQYALLVGIADYHIKPLAGPINDVLLMQSILIKKWAFKNKNMVLLLNQHGTKKNILNNMKALEKRSKPGDNIFIYLSGHGTSAQDKDFSSPLPTTSGAFIPIDIDRAKNRTQLIETLIIGRNDLKPILQKFDNNGKHVFVAIDACYSGNTVRGLYNKRKLNSRYLNISEILSSRGFGDDVNKLGSNSNWQSAKTTDSNQYPYKNIYYLSASGEFEPAQDIQANMLDRFPTIDGKPHGAFSDTLLRVLNKDIDADIDNNGYISYSELKKTVRNKMRLRGFDHTPQGLPSLAEDQSQLASRGIFGIIPKQKTVIKKPATTQSRFNVLTLDSLKTQPKPKKIATLTAASKVTQPRPNESLTLRLAIASSLTTLRQLARKIKNVSLVSKRSHLKIRADQNDILFISQAGDLILRLTQPSNRDIIEKIKHQLWIKQLIERPFKQKFNIDLDMFASGRGSTVLEGETLGIAIKSNRAAHILIININPHGNINVLYPYTKAETKKRDAYQLLAFKELSKVVAPFGREFIQVYGFSQSSKEYVELTAKTFNFDSPYAQTLKTLLQNNTIDKARASLELVTTERN